MTLYNPHIYPTVEFYRNLWTGILRYLKKSLALILKWATHLIHSLVFKDVGNEIFPILMSVFWRIIYLTYSFSSPLFNYGKIPSREQVDFTINLLGEQWKAARLWTDFPVYKFFFFQQAHFFLFWEIGQNKQTHFIFKRYFPC